MRTLFGILVLAGLCGCAGPQPAQHGVPNFQIVSATERICCGGQPTAAGWAWLVGQGYTNSVKLNLEPENAPTAVRVKRFPITTVEQIFGPVGVQLERAFLAIGPGTYVHCQKGMNRTRTLIVLHRVRTDHWSLGRAIAEAEQFGWDSSFPALKEYVEKQ